MPIPFSSRVFPYYGAQSLFVIDGKFSESRPPPVPELPEEPFSVHCTFSTLPWFDHTRHLMVATLQNYQVITCNQEVITAEGARELIFWGLTFLPPECTATILTKMGKNITEVIQTLY